MKFIKFWINYIKTLLRAAKLKNKVETAVGYQEPKMGFFKTIITYIKEIFSYKKYYQALTKHPILNKIVGKFLKKQ